MATEIKGLLGDLTKIEAGQEAALLEGLTQFAQHVLGEAKILCPIATGALRNSGFVGEAAKRQSAGVSSFISIDIGFNTRYAAAVHERIANKGKIIAHKEPTQAKFLETAMRRNESQFPVFIANKLKEKLGG